jgi:HK97 gp10 family phage protein
MQVKFEGGRELEAALSEFSKATAKNITRRALKTAADPIADAWQGRVKVLTGDLQRSIAVGTKLNRRQTGLNRAMGKAEVEIHVGTNDSAGLQEEFGNAHQAAHPAGRPAWDAEGGEAALGRIGKELSDEIEKAASRARRRALRASIR